MNRMDIVKRCEERAKRCGADISTWIYGDKLYEEVFDYPLNKKRKKSTTTLK